MNRLAAKMLSAADASQVEGLSRFFKTGKGQYGEGDVFLGIRMPLIRVIVKEVWASLDVAALEECMSSPYHEIRMAALLSLVQMFKHSPKDVSVQQFCVDFYLSHTSYINNWDLVDLSCYEILGAWLMDKDRALLYTLARDGKSIWEQRIGMVSTMAFVRAGQVDDTFGIAEVYLSQSQPLHDLLQKAGGWLLREAGKRDEQRLQSWLEHRADSMPRTMLRYAIEKFSKEDKKYFMEKKNR